MYAPCCNDHELKLSASDDEVAAITDELTSMVEGIWKRAGMPKTINAKVARFFGDKLWSGLQEGYGSMLGDVDFETPDYNMLANLQKNVYQFSAAKNWSQLRSLTSALIGEDGKLRTRSEFFKAAYGINNEHVGSWLDAERNTAIASGQMASKWVDITNNPATKLLEFDAVIDSHTSEICRPLNGVRRPPGDPFWSKWYPPNHFNCRSTVRQLNSGKATAAHDIVYPEKVPPMFQVNLAKENLAFPPGHPYWIGTPQHVKDEWQNLITPIKK